VGFVNFSAGNAKVLLSGITEVTLTRIGLLWTPLFDRRLPPRLKLDLRSSAMKRDVDWHSYFRTFRDNL
jgi:hypothetical protein